MWRTVGRAWPWLLNILAATSLLYFGRLWVLVLVNLYGPLRISSQLALLLALAAAVACAALVYGAGRLIARRAPAVGIAFALVSVVAGWQLAPTVCDTHESWIDTPNARCSCQGWTLEYYKPGVLDGSRLDYCVGWEQPVAAAPAARP